MQKLCLNLTHTVKVSSAPERTLDLSWSNWPYTKAVSAEAQNLLVKLLFWTDSPKEYLRKRPVSKKNSKIVANIQLGYRKKENRFQLVFSFRFWVVSIPHPNVKKPTQTENRHHVKTISINNGYTSALHPWWLQKSNKGMMNLRFTEILILVLPLL